MARLFVLFGIITVFSFHLYGRTNDSLVSIPYAGIQMTIDGELTDWKDFNTFLFSDTSASFNTPGEWSFEETYSDSSIRAKMKMPKSRNEVKTLLCWNLSGLYIAMNVKDKHLMAEITGGKYNPNIFLNDGIEIYIDTKADSRHKMDINDYQFIVDVLANHIVFKGDRRYQDSLSRSVPKDYGHDVLIEWAVSINGTVNNNSDNDKGYIIEIRMPFEAMGIIPEEGLEMKLDICNNDNDYKLSTYDFGDFDKIITRPFNWSGWNNFGYPDYWKTVRLSGKPGWFDKMATHKKGNWFLSLSLLSGMSFLVVAFLLFRMRKIRRMPYYKEVSPAKLLFVKKHESDEKILSLNQQYLQKASEYIDEHYSDILSSEDVAGHLGISLRKFQRITREEINCTPTNFIYIVKLNKAAEFIRNKQGTIAEAAYSFGFASHSYFTKLFKSHFGVTPMEYKNNDKHSDNNDNPANSR